MSQTPEFLQDIQIIIQQVKHGDMSIESLYKLIEEIPARVCQNKQPLHFQVEQVFGKTHPLPK